MLNKYYEQFGYVGVQQPRCYYVPFASKSEWSEDRNSSSQFTSLNGKWTIDAYECLYDVEDDFYKNHPKKEIDVPSCVQYYGMDFFQYMTHDYPIPYDPPFVTPKNPCYHYQRTFTSDTKGKKYLLFEGVDSCFYLYVNDKFVGYSQISHRVSEFDVTEYVVEGENKVDVLVLKWCAGTYFEDQDKWRFTGIFRDVYMLTRPEDHIVDYKIEAGADGVLKFYLNGNQSVKLTFNGQSRKALPYAITEFKVENVNLWSAENPYLYDLEIECNGEYILEKVGFRSVEIKNGVFLINGQPVKLKGVNRHDFHPRKGSTVSLEDIMVDLTLMKELNVNAIRTSHYPSCPEFYQLCDKYGFYVMDEADLETQGCLEIRPRSPESEIADDVRFEYPMVERQRMLVERDKNRPSVVIWSMGNECGWGKNFYACSKYIRYADSTRPIHYERVTSRPQKEGDPRSMFGDEFYTKCVDMVSHMYSRYEYFENVFMKDPKETRPFVQCEYCHAMGNGPGDFKKYWDVIYANDRYMGGFVWEWADHGVQYGADGFRYGGDYGENFHSGNFCIDGIVTPDRKIKSGTLEMKKAYEPVKIEKSGGKITITGRNYFKDLDVEVTVTRKDLGKLLSTESFEMSIAPNEKVELTVTDAQFVAVDVALNTDEPLLKKGHVIAHESFTAEIRRNLPDMNSSTVKVMKRNADFFITTASAKYIVDKVGGQISNVIVDGESVIKSPLAFNIYRAPVDNDRVVKNQWKARRMHLSYSDVRLIECDNNVITVYGVIASEKNDPIVNMVTRYTFFDEGVSISTSYSYEPRNNSEFLPRFGFVTELDKSYDKVQYYGYGPQESYIDKRWAADKDVFENTVDGMFNHYIKPQENGSHYGTERLTVYGDKANIEVYGNFSFNLSPYSIKTLEETKHDDELPVSDRNYLHLDFVMSGIGSNSCGPELAKEFRAPEKFNGNMFLFFNKENK